MRVSNRSGKPENNAPKTTYDFNTYLVLDGSIKVTTGFPIGTAVTIHFFRLTLRVPVSTRKKCVVIGFDNVKSKNNF